MAAVEWKAMFEATKPYSNNANKEYTLYEQKVKDDSVRCKNRKVPATNDDY